MDGARRHWVRATGDLLSSCSSQNLASQTEGNISQCATRSASSWELYHPSVTCVDQYVEGSFSSQGVESRRRPYTFLGTKQPQHYKNHNLGETPMATKDDTAINSAVGQMRSTSGIEQFAETADSSLDLPKLAPVSYAEAIHTTLPPLGPLLQYGKSFVDTDTDTARLGSPREEYRNGDASLYNSPNVEPEISRGYDTVDTAFTRPERLRPLSSPSLMETRQEQGPIPSRTGDGDGDLSWNPSHFPF